MFHATRSDVRPDDIPDWAIKLAATISIILIAGLCAISAKAGTRAAVLFMASKVRSLFLVDHMPFVHLLGKLK